MSWYQKKHSPTHTHHGHQSSQSAFSIYYDPWHPPYSIHVLYSLFRQSLSKFSLLTMENSFCLVIENMSSQEICNLLLSCPVLCLEYIGSRAPLSSKRPFLSLYVSVCLFVRCPRLFTHFRLTDLDETWQLGTTLAQTRCFEVSATCAP